MSLPTVYELYTGGGITSGLSVNQPFFTLNNVNITIYSGAMHYFRVPAEYWRDRLRKMRAAGLNTVETYVPWNLHEPQIGTFDFEGGLDIAKFLKTAQEEDLLAIVRPGPYICSEWDFGGLPSWLLREKGIQVRTSDSKFMKHVTRYFSYLLPILALLQFTNGGPVIAVQVENEYGSTESPTFTPDLIYVEQLRKMMLDHNIKELLFTSDSPYDHGDIGTLPSLFQTANFADDVDLEFAALDRLQPGKPFMVMEYWTGWFDHWGEKHHLRNNTEFERVLDEILTYPASVNFYMFHGGTNFGFMNGANIARGVYQPDVTSYDYDAPLSENGDYTDKYRIVQRLIAKYNSVPTKLPELPEEIPRVAYENIAITQYLPYSEVLKQLPVLNKQKLTPMELLPINGESGQSYGFIIYRASISTSNSTLEIKNEIHDSLLLLLNNKLILKPVTKLSDPGYWLTKDLKVPLPDTKMGVLDIVVENWGRNNFGQLETFDQFKGLRGDVYLDGRELTEWSISPMEFKSQWIEGLKGWIDGYSDSTSLGLHKAILELDQEPQDTFIDMREWNAGIVIVNGRVLGRYLHIGPQQTLYLPGVFLKKGTNEIIVFEHYEAPGYVKFSDKPIYLTKTKSKNPSG